MNKKGRKLGSPNRPRHYESPLSERLGMLITTSRTAAGLRQKDLAEKAGIAESTVRKIERGEGTANMEFVEYVLRVLGYRISFERVRGDQ
jgi:ribosome-binding protein aMBF1 (putative translation factor)